LLLILLWHSAAALRSLQQLDIFYERVRIARRRGGGDKSRAKATARSIQPGC
uniref:Transposase n=1 Tax=Taenia asiatica TaxID=60517 RepID=A0A0R3WET4_TAEAS